MNWNILAPLLTIRNKCWLIFILHCLTSKWFTTIVVGQSYSHLTTCLIVIPNSFLSFHQTLWLSHLAWLLYFLMLCLSCSRKQCDSGAIFYLIFLDCLPLFCRNRRYKFWVSIQLPLSSCLQWINVERIRLFLRFTGTFSSKKNQILSKLFNVMISIIQVRILIKIYNANLLLIAM